MTTTEIDPDIIDLKAVEKEMDDWGFRFEIIKKNIIVLLPFKN